MGEKFKFQSRKVKIFQLSHKLRYSGNRGPYTLGRSRTEWHRYCNLKLACWYRGSPPLPYYTSSRCILYYSKLHGRWNKDQRCIGECGPDRKRGNVVQYAGTVKKPKLCLRQRESRGATPFCHATCYLQYSLALPWRDFDQNKHRSVAVVCTENPTDHLRTRS
jgi:hypothetical protein